MRARDIRPTRRNSRCSVEQLRTRLRHFSVVVAAIAAGSLAAPVAKADVLLTVASTNVTNLFGGASYLVDFNGTTVSGGTEFTFATSAANTRVAVFFSAECGVDGATTQNVNVDIVIDPAGSAPPVTAKPTAGSDVLCSGNGTTTATYPAYYIDGMVRTTVVAYYDVPSKGTHTIRVVLNGNLALSRLSNMSLIVMR